MWKISVLTSFFRSKIISLSSKAVSIHMKKIDMSRQLINPEQILLGCLSLQEGFFFGGGEQPNLRHKSAKGSIVGGELNR